MADKKISQLTALSAANLAPSTDVLAIVDTSATETKKIVAQDLVNGVLNVASAVGIGTASPGSVGVSGYTRLVLGAGSSATDGLTIVPSGTGGVQFTDAANVKKGYLQWDSSTGALALGTAGTTKATLDSSGNLGLGVTPSLWQTGAKAVEIGGSGYLAFTGSTNGGYLYSNAYLAAGGNTYKAAGYAAAYGLGPSGQHQWFIAPSWNGTGSNAISFTQAMTLSGTSDVNLLLGTTSAAYATSGRGLFEVNGSSSALIAIKSGDTARGYFAAGSTATELAAVGASQPLLFTTNSGERGRFTAGGYFKASNDGTYTGATASYHELRSNASGTRTVEFVSTHASNPYGAFIQFSAAAPDNNTNWFLSCQDNTAVRCYIWSDGDLANHDGVYGTISDERLKQDIVDASSQWNDLKAIRFRKYRMKTDVEANPDAPAMFGVVAQELAEVCPGLVDEHPNMKTVEVTDEEGNVTQTQEPDGTTTMTVKSSILLMKAAKALQEAMARIEQLEAKVAALEAK